jgi:phosphoribosylanthranilate isomerase
VTTIEDIRALMELVPLGVEGAIAGTALYTGSLSLTEALQETRGETS